MNLRDYTFLGTTKSLCPDCRRLVEAKIITRRGRVYFRKHCPEHGVFEDFVCSDVAYFDRNEFSQPARLPRAFGTSPDRGCPYDCGLCTEHEQHTCIALIEITSSCNLRCPMCFAESGPGGTHIDFDTFRSMVDRYVALEGVADVLQISGGEPTIHPELVRFVRYAYEQPIAAVMINTNGIRLAKDPALVEALAPMRDRLEIYLQFDGFDDRTHAELRGEQLLDIKLAALDMLRRHDLRCTLVCTVDHNTNLHEVGKVLEFGLERPGVRGISYQLATYCGRHLAPGDLEHRATMPDVVKALIAQTPSLLDESDFYPLPCAHPNCHMMAYLYRGGPKPIPISRLIDVKKHLDLIANSVIYTPARARHLVQAYLDRAGVDCGCGPNGCAPEVRSQQSEVRSQESEVRSQKSENGEYLAPERYPRYARRGPDDSQSPDFSAFIDKALTEKLSGADVFRITLTAFLDVHNFDVRRVMKCCLAHVLPSGHVVPFCAYNTLYRDGHVPLPPLADAALPQRQTLQVTE